MPELQPKIFHEVPKEEPAKDIEKEPTLEFINFREFPNLDKKTRGEILEYLKSSDSIHGAKYKFMDFDYEKYLLNNPDRAPQSMKGQRKERFYFFQPDLANRTTSLSYLTWNGKSFSRFIEVPNTEIWDPNIDRIVATPK